MNHVYQRLALLTGVSVSALGLANPAAAATSPGFEHVVTAPNVSDTLTICDIGDTCDFGVSSSGAGAVSAIVNSAALGQVRQVGTATAVGGDVTLHMINGGDAAFLALASASGAGGAATAFASIAPAIAQSGHGGGDIALDLTNDGSLQLQAVADASATASAFALATAYGGIQQFASSTGTGDASIAMTNDASILAAATAHAEATSGNAHATAAAVYGVGARAIAADGDASIALTNNGNLSVSANAAATGGHTGDAVAVAAGGMVAFATGLGSGDASAVMANDGALLVEANAHAIATTNALAVAIGVTGMYDVAHAATGDAFASIENSGSVDVVANATATGLVAQATAIGGAALFGGGVYESAAAMNGSAHGVLDNSGDITMSANAAANGSVIAYAIAFGGPGVEQLVFATGGDATADLANSGSILLSANAAASATNSAYATALYFNGFNNAAFANSGDALVNMTNDGALAINVTAQAVADNVAGAHASASHVVGQFGIAFSGDVQASLANDGSIMIGADATAVGASALANATVAQAFYQSAFAIGGGEAHALLTNSGDIMIDAAASASGTAALAAAAVETAIYQFAQSSGSGDASAAVLNSGDLGISVTANAHGVSGATAVANVYRGIGNYANALGSGDAFASVTNSGDILVSADAAATVEGTAGTAFAVGFISNAIQQTVYAQSGLASGSIDNSGTITVAANAFASGVTTAPVTATSAVNATAQAYNSFAIDQTGTAASGDVALSFNNSGAIDITVNAAAVAGVGGSGTEAGIAFASAYMHDPVYQHAYAPGGDISIAGSNAGTMDISAVAQATGAVGIAQVQIEYGISQYASAAGGDADVGFVNSGAIHETAAAAGHGTSGFGFGLAALTSALFQLASGAGDATVHFDNSGTFDAVATAAGDGVTGAGAGAFLDEAINQFAIASGAAVAAMTNSGSINLDAAAAAHAATGPATGIAFVSHAVSQHAYGGSSANVSLTNSGHITIAAVGSGVADDFRGFGEAGVFDGIFQSASASGAATASFVNSGTLEVSADAHGVGGQVGRAVAVIAPAIIQQAWGTSAHVTLDNSGKIDVAAIAQATGGIGAPAIAQATAIVQLALGGTASLINSGTIAVTASAQATDTGSSAFVGVDALGIYQVGHDSLNRLDNSGTLSVKAIAEAGGLRGFEGGSATGFYVRGDSAELDVANSGTIEVEALGQAPDGARMEAIGIRADAIGGSAATATAPALISGSIVNDGMLHVVATAAGGGPLVTQTFSGATLTFDQSSAQAIGISMYVGATNATITNSGTIDVEAVTANGGPADAHGIWVQNNYTGLPPTAADVLTINNSGDIIVRQSTDGGDSWQRGMAIDVATAPNATVINLLGGGVIYGNIAVQAGDEINVAAGTTYFDGIINPAYLPAGEITAADLDSGLFGVGTLNIGDGGNLVLADPRLTGPASMYDGPAYALVHTLNMAADGTLTFELQPAAGGTQPVGSYPQVFADTANLGGTLAADLATPNGLFADSYFWNNVIDANTLNGTFDRCVVGGGYAGSVLLNAACSYDAGANVDLTLTRVAFNAVAGLNGNGTSVGAGLEGVYSTSLTGGAADMFGDLFRISSAADYNTALNELSGSAYANYLQSFPSLGVHYNDLLDHATDCEVPALAGSVLECRTNPIHVWGQLDYQTRKADGDVEAGTAKSKRFTGLLGVDASVGNAAVIGLSAGRVTNHVRDHQFGDTVDADGMQVGAYAAYDPGAFFVKGVTTYSWYDGDSTRHIDFTPFGGTFHGTPAGDPDVRMWTAGLHGGARFPMGASSAVTPYVNLDYVHAKLDGFTETGLDGADLTVEGGKSNHSFATAGVKWAGQFGGVVPEVNVAYRYRFGNARSRFTAAFLGDTSNDFDVVSASQKRGTFLAGLSVGGKVGPVDLRIGYEGEFNGDITSHSGNFKLVLPLGGHASPPPAPAPVVAPPPPPPPAEAAPEAAPPPAPPPPAERGERG